MTKMNELASTACLSWGSDWAGTKGSVEPTASQIIRATAACGWAGHTRAIREVYAVPMSGGWIRCSRPATAKVHADGGMSGSGSIGMANLARANRLIARYRRFVAYMTETRHAWTKVRDLYYADNSIEVEERSSLTGAIRCRMTLAPGGDLCY